MTLRCLIVDDNPEVLLTASHLLRSQGIDVVGVAASSAEATSLVNESRPDVVLIDIILGADSGFDLARELGETLGSAGSACIMISTHDAKDFEDLIAASPAIGFLAKSDLSATAIRRLLAGTRGEDDIGRPGT